MGRDFAGLRLAMAAAVGLVAIAILPAPVHAGPVTSEVPCSDRPDLTPPSVPPNARYTAGPMTTLSWDPSTDDTGVRQYQVFHRTMQIATTTATSITIATPPPIVTTFGIRAVDAAGNTSPFAPIRFGQLPDLTPPTVPANLRLTAVCRTSVAVRWDPSTDETFLVGYEVFVGGALVTTVGDSRALVPNSPSTLYPKRLRFLIRAKDSSGNYSPFYQASITIWRAPS